MTDLESKLLSLLDLIAITGDASLATQRFDLGREAGYEVVFTDEKISGETH